MKVAPDAVASQPTAAVAACLLSDLVDGLANFSKVNAGATNRDPSISSTQCRLTELVSGPLRSADEEHGACVAMVPVEKDGHVNVDDVTLFENSIVRNAMCDDVIDARADRLCVAHVPQGAGVGTTSADEVVDGCVNCLRRATRIDQAASQRQRFPSEGARFSHGLDLAWAFDLDPRLPLLRVQPLVLGEALLWLRRVSRLEVGRPWYQKRHVANGRHVAQLDVLPAHPPLASLGLRSSAS
mmetsp:Transcript_67733/g.175441  ORF Transcript_67733/g.175441 Transcript_67733/m.175441 type:complete len:241 (+) Transcript_67733:352-1074(+)